MAVKSLDFNEKRPGTGDMFLRVKQKGDRVQFRIAQKPAYTGKHFMQEGGSWVVTECERESSGDECEMCEQFFKLMGKIKQIKASDSTLTNDSPKIKELTEEARKYRASIEWYMAIIDRTSGAMRILQTTDGVRRKFEAQAEAGIDVYETEWILQNTGSKSPTERYLLTPVDSSKVADMTEEELMEFEKAKKFDMSSIGVGGGSSDKDDNSIDSY